MKNTRRGSFGSVGSSGRTAAPDQSIETTTNLPAAPDPQSFKTAPPDQSFIYHISASEGSSSSFLVSLLDIAS